MEASQAAARQDYPDEVSRAHYQLRAMLISGELAAGDILSQVELAQVLGVSRGPLREALRILQREGFIEQQSQHRARVAPFSEDDLDELYAMRIALESLAIAIAVPLMTEADHADLYGLLHDMEQAAQQRDLRRWEGPHSEFHQRLIRPAGHRLERELTLMADHATRYRLAYVSWNPREWQAGTREHETIALAARRGDSEAAARELAAHLGRTALVVLSIAAPGYEPRRIRRALSQPDVPPAAAGRPASQ